MNESRSELQSALNANNFNQNIGTNCNSLNERMVKIETIQNSYSSSLGIQTGFYSIIVFILITLYFFFQYKISKNEIRKSVNKAVEDIERNLNESLVKDTEKIKSDINTLQTKHEHKLLSLEANISRSIALSARNSNIHNKSFDWWMVTASLMSQLSEDELTRIALRNAISEIKHVQDVGEIDLGAYNKAIKEIEKGDYKLETNLLEKSIRKIMEK